MSRGRHHVASHPLESGRLAWWLTAWLRGQVGPDDLAEAVLGADAAHDVLGLGSEPVPLVLALGRLRDLGTTHAGLAVPTDGDPVGLGGPADFNLAALEAGQAVVLAGPQPGLGLIPHRAGAGVTWRLRPANRRQLPDLGEADRELRRCLSTAANALADLDVAGWRPEVADELMDLRRTPRLQVPTGIPARCAELAGRGWQALRIVELANADDGAAVSATRLAQRREALAPLARAARRALVAAGSPEAWPP